MRRVFRISNRTLRGFFSQEQVGSSATVKNIYQSLESLPEFKKAIGFREQRSFSESLEYLRFSLEIIKKSDPLNSQARIKLLKVSLY